MSGDHVIIIGAGVGGLATAILLARKGMTVTIFEKNQKPGGRCQRICRDGHVFDTGPTMYIFPRLYADFFAMIGEDVSKHLELLAADPSYQLNFGDGSQLLFTNDSHVMRRQLEAIESGSYVQFLKYLEVGKRHHLLAINQLIGRDYQKPWEYFSLKNLWMLLKNQAVEPHYQFVSRYFKDERLRAAFTFQDSYLSLHPFQAPSIFSMFFQTEFEEGSFLPKGGMYEVIQSLETIAVLNGVEIKYGHEVKQIAVSSGLAEGVVCGDNVYKADYVVVNADLSWAYNHLLPMSGEAKRLMRKRYSCSALVYHWGVDKRYQQLMTHNLFFGNDYRGGFDAVLSQCSPPGSPHFYVQAPTRTDPSRAPFNADTLSVMVPINHLDDSVIVDWKEYRDRTRVVIIKRLADLGMNDLNNHIKFEICHLPTDWQDYLNLPYGAIYGLDHNLGQLGYLRSGRRHKDYQNVFFVGASTHPGSGLPTVLASARFTSEMIVQ